MHKNDVFDYADYVEYIAHYLSSRRRERGIRSRLAASIGCHLSYISQVLKGHRHFTLEQAAAINLFCGHTDPESHCFLLLVHKARAGTPVLRKYYDEQLSRLVQSRREIKNRIVAQEVKELDQAIYYSAWYYVAVHQLLSIERFQSPDRLAQALGLSNKTISEVMEFLRQAGLVEVKGGGYRLTNKHIHLPATSKLIGQHHSNWRLKSLERLNSDKQGLHYSTVYALSNAAAEKISNVLLASVEEANAIALPTKEETAYCMAFDFFSVV